jgi:hypothetical protein
VTEPQGQEQEQLRLRRERIEQRQKESRLLAEGSREQDRLPEEQLRRHPQEVLRGQQDRRAERSGGGRLNPDPGEALEMLAILSYVARFVDRSNTAKAQ